MRIGIATEVLTEGDAVGGDVLGTFATLKEAGHDPVLYARAADVPLPVTPLDQVADVDVYIYHHSTNCPWGVKHFRDLRCRKIVKYHNVTPPHFFEPGGEAAEHCRRGLEQLRDVLAQPCEVWVASEYNGLDLQQVARVGFTVIPPFNQVGLLRRTREDVRAVLPFNDWNTNLLMVGRVAPNKDVLAGIDVLASYARRNEHCRLLVVGDDRGPYAGVVRDRIALLGLNNVVLTGKVSPATLKAFYLIADVLVIPSRHEGFCIPMVEAMALNVPVVSSRAAALPETGGDAVRYANNPDEMAAAIEHVLRNRGEFLEKGRQRFREKFQDRAVASLLFSALFGPRV